MDFSLVTLGCDKNRVDSEKMLYNLQNAGHTLVNEEQAEFIVINTCAFIDKAKKEAIQTIFDVSQLKKSGKLKKLIVTGCFAQRYAGEVTFDEVDCFVNIAEEVNIVKIVDEIFGKSNCNYVFQDKRTLTTPMHYAYIKIADGCNNRCSYCAIPYIRGKYVSRPMEELISEAKELADNKVKELILVAQDTTYYGKDIYGEYALSTLLEELSKLDFWKIRVMYAYPERIDDKLLNIISNNEKVAKYLDIPFQHIDDTILKSMRRRSGEKEIRELIKKIETKYSNIALRSSFIVGYPTEDLEANLKLRAFVSGALNYSGFFSYSKEEGTPAYKLKATQTKKTILGWVKECEKAQVLATMEKQKKYVNEVLEVLYEGIDYKKQCFYGRSEFNAPEIDTKVYFTSQNKLEVGNVYKVKITASDFHLYGETV